MVRLGRQELFQFDQADMAADNVLRLSACPVSDSCRLEEECVRRIKPVACRLVGVNLMKPAYLGGNAPERPIKGWDAVANTVVMAAFLYN